MRKIVGIAAVLAVTACATAPTVVAVGDEFEVSYDPMLSSDLQVQAAMQATCGDKTPKVVSSRGGGVFVPKLRFVCGE